MSIKKIFVKETKGKNLTISEKRERLLKGSTIPSISLVESSKREYVVKTRGTIFGPENRKRHANKF